MRAAITGIGAVTALGRGTARLWDAMAAGEQGISRIARFATDGFDVQIAGVVPDRNDPRWADPGAALCIELAVDAAREALDAAGLDAAPDRIALVHGSSLGDHDLALHEVTRQIADAIGARGPRITVSTACTSSSNALGIGLDLLEQGAADAVIAGGADTLTPMVLAGFLRLGVLSALPCAPFSHPPGTTLGEGAGFVVLERRARGRARHAVLGYGLSSDAYHETGPDPSGAGVARAIRNALAHAGVSADAIDYVNAHGTGTAAGDPAEWRALRQVLGARADRVPVSSSKSFLGHAQGAAGVLELIATLVALDRAAIPPTRNFAGPRPNSPPDPVACDRPRPASVRHTLCNSSGFGGANCAVIVGPIAALDPPVAPAARPVFVTGLGAVGPHRRSLEVIGALGAPGGTAPGIAGDARGVDAMTRFLVSAAGEALADAGVRLRGAMHERSGLVIGTTRVSRQSEDQLLRSIDDRGLRQLSAVMFSRMVLNAPVGACAKQLALKGPLTTISTGDGSGLTAIAQAAHLLATRGDLDRAIAGGVEEERGAPGPTVEGAVTALLSTEPPAGPRIRLAGWGLAGPDGRAHAARAALSQARCAAVDLVVGSAVPGVPCPRVVAPDQRGGAAASALGFAIAVAALRRADIHAALVVSEPCASIACALHLVAEAT
ncbi:MAG TPA: beta-ketoacyl synthase N-terminal-like domain-containing protein [Kofleriaceae bacterium]|jgi:3-oxoacyl-[acyl-carrier-protein] synthase II|nr:beta-ketoacyl synthase N-terminal-like domain-containing protein [Kofleriaceae bacterium]